MDKRVSMELTDRRKTAINLVHSRKNGKAFWHRFSQMTANFVKHFADKQ